jgi:hypothetical protein
MTLVAYLSHPIGEMDSAAEQIARHDNIRNAGEWLEFLIELAEWAILCPWLAYVTPSIRKLHGPRAFVHQIIILERCDLLVQVGGMLTSHMAEEQRHAIRHDIPVIDLTHHGERPPLILEKRDAAEQDVRQHALRLMGRRRRRQWLPPLTVEEVNELRLAQRRLAADPEAVDAAAIVLRIAQAAMKP